MSVTTSGEKCAFWSDVIKYSAEDVTLEYFRAREESLEDAANFCRNPTENDLTVWCYIADGNGTWEYCDVSTCPGKATL